MLNRGYRMGQKQKPQIGQMGHKQVTWLFTNSAVWVSNLVTHNASYLPFQRPGDLLLWSTSMFQNLWRHYSVSSRCNVHFWCKDICTNKSSGKEHNFLYEHKETSKLGRKKIIYLTVRSSYLLPSTTTKFY